MIVPPPVNDQLYPVIPGSVVYTTGVLKQTLEGPSMVGTGSGLTVIIADPVTLLEQLAS
jgi:hypothetical protein